VSAGVIRCGVCGRVMDSHRVHDRAGYRCRHGHTSTRTRTSAQPTILYIREDHLLDHIRHDCGLHRRHPALRSPDPEKLANYLRTNNMNIVCDHHAWTIEAETAIYALTPAGSFLATTAKSPPNGTGITQNTNNHHSSCGNNVSEIIRKVRG
jgi:site-specific DNA recombinase